MLNIGFQRVKDKAQIFTRPGNPRNLKQKILWVGRKYLNKLLSDMMIIPQFNTSEGDDPA